MQQSWHHAPQARYVDAMTCAVARRCLSWRRESPGLAVVITVLVTYLLLVPPTVLGGDSGEFALLAHVNGIAHPPGYPLYVLILRLLAWWPAQSPAQAAGLVTAAIAGLQMLALYAACRGWGARPLAAAIAVGLYAGSELCVVHYTHAEVFALNGLIVALILCWSAPAAEGSQWPLVGGLRLGGLGLLSGLGLSHHHSFVLVVPVIGLAVLWGLQEIRARRRRRLALLLPLALLVGLLPNLLLFSWSQAADVYLNSWSEIRSWPQFWHHWLRRDYGTLSLAYGGHAAAAGLLNQLRLLGLALVDVWRFLIVLAPLALVLELRASRFRRRSWWGWLALLLSLVMAGPVFFSRANIDPSGLVSWEVLERFYLLPALLLALPVAAGLDHLWTWLLRLRPAAGLRSPRVSELTTSVLFCGVAIYAFAFNAFIAIRLSAERRGAHTQDLLLNGLNSLPRDAIVLDASDDGLFGGAYVQHALRVRPDVTIIPSISLRWPWYLQRLRRRLPDCRLDVIPIATALATFASHCERPVFSTSAYYFAGDRKAPKLRLPNYQYGIYRRVLPPSQADQLPSADQLLRLNQTLFARFKGPAQPLSLAYGWASHPYYIYAGVWQQIAAEMKAQSRPDLMELALQQRRRYGYALNGIGP